MKPSEVAELVMMLVAAYPSAKPNAATSQVYEAMLVDLDLKSARAAAQNLIASSKWMPTVAEIREECAALEKAQLAERARAKAARIPSLTMAQLRARDAGAIRLLPPPNVKKSG